VQVNETGLRWVAADHGHVRESGATGQGIKLESAIKGGAVPLHPGAENYDKEVGMVQLP